MNRSLVVLLGLGAIALIVLLLSNQYLFSPPYVAECEAQETYSVERDNCIESVAVITHNENLCQRNQFPEYCIEKVRSAENTSEWEIQSKTYESELASARLRHASSKYNASGNGVVLQCAVDGRADHTVDITSTKEAFNYEFSYTQVSFVEGCEGILSGANTSVCSGAQESDQKRCAMNINLVNNASFEETCSGGYCARDYASYHNDPSACFYYGDEECYVELAIRNNDPYLCSRTYYLQGECYSYFAFKEKDIGYCGQIPAESEFYRHCRAVILALESEE